MKLHEDPDVVHIARLCIADSATDRASVPKLITSNPVRWCAATEKLITAPLDELREFRTWLKDNPS